MLSVASIIAMFPLSSYAAQPPITIDQTFTYEDGLWAPGKIESKDFYINNHNENDVSIDRLFITLKSSQYWKTGEELDINSPKFKEFAKYSTVTLKHGDTILFQDTFQNLLAKRGIKLSKDLDIKAKDRELLNMTIDMDLEMNNDAQALNNTFKIGVAYSMDEPTNPPTDNDKPNKPPVNPDNPSNPDNGGSEGNLPQTGGIINNASLIALGAVAIGTGFMMNRKSDKKGGDKNNE